MREIYRVDKCIAGVFLKGKKKIRQNASLSIVVDFKKNTTKCRFPLDTAPRSCHIFSMGDAKEFGHIESGAFEILGYNQQENSLAILVWMRESEVSTENLATDYGFSPLTDSSRDRLPEIIDALYARFPYMEGEITDKNGRTETVSPRLQLAKIYPGAYAGLTSPILNLFPENFLYRKFSLIFLLNLPTTTEPIHIAAYPNKSIIPLGFPGGRLIYPEMNEGNLTTTARQVWHSLADPSLNGIDILCPEHYLNIFAGFDPGDGAAYRPNICGFFQLEPGADDYFGDPRWHCQLSAADYNALPYSIRMGLSSPRSYFYNWGFSTGLYGRFNRDAYGWILFALYVEEADYWEGRAPIFEERHDGLWWTEYKQYGEQPIEIKIGPTPRKGKPSGIMPILAGAASLIAQAAAIWLWWLRIDNEPIFIDGEKLKV